MVTYTFYLIFCIESTLLIFVLINANNQANYIWPPQAGKTQSIYALMFIFYSIIASSIWIGICERTNPLFVAKWFRYVGIFILTLGIVLYTWCRMYISKKIEFGGKGRLITQGPYQYTRNPLYIADTLIFLGFAIISNSLLVYILMILLVIILLFLPLLEEPWLLEQYGKQYEDYMSKVPRYIKI